MSKDADDFIRLSALSAEDVKGCEDRASTCKDADKRKRLLIGFMAELALARRVEEDVPGAVQSCVMQQLRSRAKSGPDFLSVDVKSSANCESLEKAKGYNLQVKNTSLAEGGAENFAFVPYVDELGCHVVMGWATRRELLEEGSKTQWDGMQLPVHQLQKPKKLLEVLRRKGSLRLLKKEK